MSSMLRSRPAELTHIQPAGESIAPSQTSHYSHTLSTLSSKLEHLTRLQQQLEDSLKDRPPPSDPSNYTAYYFMKGDEDESSDTEKHKSSTPKRSPPAKRRLSSDLEATTAALRDATAQVHVLMNPRHRVQITLCEFEGAAKLN